MEYKFKDNQTFEVEKTVDDKIELIKGVSEVRSKIRDVVSDDFILCKLTPQEKEYIIELTNNAFLSRKILKSIENQAKKWEWNDKTKTWNKRYLNKEEKEYVQALTQTCFDSYMNRIYMITITNRNVPKNYIVEKITGVKDSEEEEETRMETLTKKIRNRLGLENDKKEAL